MKILVFGTCRVLQLFDTNLGCNIANTFLDSLQSLNYGCFGGKNVISLTHDCNQVSYLLNLIKNKVLMNESNIEMKLFKNMSVFIQNIGDYRQNLLSVIPNYDINESIINIHNELNNIEYIIIEVCTLKKLVKSGIPQFYDICNIEEFNEISDEEFADDFSILVNLIKSINENIKIIFISHINSYNNEIIPERLHILNLLEINSKKYNNCYVLSPMDYISNEDLEDNMHYKQEFLYKILNGICDKIIDIESSIIVNKMNHTGIMQLNISKYLNNKEIVAFENINKVLDEMIVKIKNNEHNNIKTFPSNHYMYIVNNYINEPFNLNNQIYKDFFIVVLNKIIIKIAEKYLENDVFIYNPLIAVNYNCNKMRQQSQNWHRDPGGRKIIKFFIFFDDVSKENGSFEYIPNTQYTSLSKITNMFDYGDGRSIYPNSNEFQELANNNGIITNCKKYDIVAVDTSGFHRAGLCSENNYRKYLHILFLTKDNIINNKDPCDLYQNGFNYNTICNVDKNNINNILNVNVSQYFY